MGDKNDASVRSTYIFQIVRWRIPHYTSALVGGMNADARREVLKEAQALVGELKGKTDAEIKQIYEAEKERPPKQAALKVALEEKQRFFSQPDAQADFEHWSKATLWTLDEAIALAFGKAPETVSWRRVEPYSRVSPFAKQYGRVRDLALRAKKCKQLYDPVLPGFFLAWALRNDIGVPEELIRQVEARGIVVADWRDLYESLKKEFDDYRQTSKQQTAEFNKALQSVRARLHEMHAEKASEQPLRESERGSLLKMIFGMAVAAYDYKPHVLRNTATGENKGSIHHDLNRLSLDLDVDTIRRYIKEAESQFRDLFQNPRKT